MGKLKKIIGTLLKITGGLFLLLFVIVLITDNSKESPISKAPLNEDNGVVVLSEMEPRPVEVPTESNYEKNKSESLQKNSNPLDIDVSSSKDYSVISVDTARFIHTPTRMPEGKVKLIIHSPEANDFTSRAQTAIKAAIEYTKSHQVAVIKVMLSQTTPKTWKEGDGATATFYKSGLSYDGSKAMNVWEVKASTKEYSELEIKVNTTWDSYLYEYKRKNNKDSLSDEEYQSIQKAISDSLAISVEDAKSKYLIFEMNEYMVE